MFRTAVVVVLSGAVLTYNSSKSLTKERIDVNFDSSKSLSEDQTSVVIGTGVVGLTSAYYLAKSGHQVICIERREDVALETSYKNGAFMCPSQSIPWANAEFPKKYVKGLFTFPEDKKNTKIWFSTVFSRKFYRWLYLYLKNCTRKAQMKNSASLQALSTYSLKCLNDILEENSISFSRYAQGSIQIIKDETMLKQLNKSNDKIVLTPEEIVKKEPLLADFKDDLYAGIYSPLGSNGNMFEFCCQLRDILIHKYNVQFLFNEQVDDFVVSHVNDKRHITAIQTKTGTTISSIDNVIVANGNDMMQLMNQLNVYMPIYPVKGYVVEIITPPDIRIPSVNLIDVSNRLYVTALKPNEKGSAIRISGSVEFAGWKDIGEVSEPARAQLLYEQTLKWLPHLSSYEKVFHSCSRPVSPDDLPLTGQCDNFDNLYVNGGHGSRGWRLAFGSAAMLADIINQKQDSIKTKQIDRQPYDPNRFSLF